MRNKYVGDVGDFGKYGLLRALCKGNEHRPDLRLGVVWYLVSEKGLEYLSKAGERRFAACDEDLYNKLARIVQAGSVSAVEQGEVLPPNTVFFSETIGLGPTREEWLHQAAERMKDCEVVFLDPDTGLKDSPQRSDDARFREYAYLDEVSKFAGYGGDRSVVIYHHLGQQRGHKLKHDEEIADQLTRLRQQFPKRSPFALRFRPYSPRAFLVVPAPAHGELLRGRAKAFLQTPWGSGKEPHFAIHWGT